MKIKFFIPSFLFFIGITIQTYSQTNSKPVEYALRATRSGPDTIIIDKQTTISDLISRLEKPWEFVNTGIGYWIGYTDDMFQIAYHKKDAVEPLLHLINSTDSLRARIAALYTLHLIGINSSVVSTVVENFRDTIVRKAILSLVNDKQLNRDVAFLLKRDPWQMDIPYFMDYLTQTETGFENILSALRKYFIVLDIENRPLFEDLPQDIYDKEVTIRTDSADYFHPMADLLGLKNALGNQIEIDEEIMDSKKWKEGLKAFKNAKGEDLIHTIHLDDGSETSTKPRLGDIDSFRLNSAIDFAGWDDPRLFYSFHDNKLFIHSAKNTRIIILDWWKSLSGEEKRKILTKKGLYDSLKIKYSR